MKVRAKHSVKYDGSWKKPGEVFDISLTEFDQMSAMVDVVEPIDRDAEPDEAETPAEEARPSRRGGRPKKR